MTIRPFQPNDSEQIAQLFHDTVREVNSSDYSEMQLRAWAPDNIHYKDWEALCLSKYTFVADENGTIAGFVQLEADGHIDCFYCHKDYQRRGVGSKLYTALEQQAKNMELASLYVESSITARPFFESRGFNIIREQLITIRGEQLINFTMKKELAS